MIFYISYSWYYTHFSRLVTYIFVWLRVGKRRPERGQGCTRKQRGANCWLCWNSALSLIRPSSPPVFLHPPLSQLSPLPYINVHPLPLSTLCLSLTISLHFTVLTGCLICVCFSVCLSLCLPPFSLFACHCLVRGVGGGGVLWIVDGVHLSYLHQAFICYHNY